MTQKTEYHLGQWDLVGYYISVVFSLGGTWILKTIIAKAITDALKNQGE
ncbi:MAG: hypothetical protein ABSE04_02540 [Candidatus Microgenomates bacterium]